MAAMWVVRCSTSSRYLSTHDMTQHSVGHVTKAMWVEGVWSLAKPHPSHPFTTPFLRFTKLLRQPPKKKTSDGWNCSRWKKKMFARWRVRNLWRRPCSSLSQHSCWISLVGGPKHIIFWIYELIRGISLHHLIVIRCYVGPSQYEIDSWTP